MDTLINARLIHWTVLIAAFACAIPASGQTAGSPAQAQATPTADKPPATAPEQADETATSSLTGATPEQSPEAQIQTDTKKLYQLALELRSEVAKTYKQSLSVTVLNKAEELEKLAKTLHSEMNREAAARRH